MGAGYLGSNPQIPTGGRQAPPSFWKVPGLPWKFSSLPRKFPSDFPKSSLTVELNSNPEVPRRFPRLPRKFAGLPWKFPGSFPDFPGGQPLSLGILTDAPDSRHSIQRQSIHEELAPRIFSIAQNPQSCQVLPHFVIP